MIRPQTGTLLFVVTEEWYFRSHRMDLALAAASAGYDVHVACRTYKGSDFQENELHFHSIDWARSDSLIQGLKSIGPLQKLISTLEPDIVHNVSLKPILLGSAAALFSKAQVVNAVTGLGLAFSSNHLKFKVLTLIVIVFLSVMNLLKKPFFIFQNTDDKTRLNRMGALTAERVEIIRGSGVNTQVFRYSIEPETATVCISVVCRMLYLKGVADLVEASDILLSRDIAHTLLLTGAPDPENPSSIDEDTLNAWNQKPQIRWQGQIDDVYSILTMSHISALASHGGEGLPKSLLEAASVGRPLIATDVPGNREIVKPDINGLLVPPHSPTKLADAMQVLIEDVQLRAKYGRQSRKLIEDEFSSTIVKNQTLALYERIVPHH